LGDLDQFREGNVAENTEGNVEEVIDGNAPRVPALSRDPRGRAPGMAEISAPGGR
jgi:hypothetical protein